MIVGKAQGRARGEAGTLLEIEDALARDFEFECRTADGFAEAGKLDAHARIANDLTFAQAVSRALQAIGLSAATLPRESITVPGKIRMFGRVPLGIDLLTQPSGIEFESARPRRIIVELDGTPVNVTEWLIPAP